MTDFLKDRATQPQDNSDYWQIVTVLDTMIRTKQFKLIVNVSYLPIQFEIHQTDQIRVTVHK